MLCAVQNGRIESRPKRRGRGLGLYYELYELNHAALSPFRAAADATRLYFQNPLNPLTHTPFGRSIAAAAEVFERTTRRYGKPEWGIAETTVGGERVPVSPARSSGERPFCNLLHFDKPVRRQRPQRTQAAHRRADVGPLRHAAARHRRDHAARARRLHHRLGRRAHGAAERGHLRSRRLHRLRDLDAARAGAGRARHGGVPAVGAGARRDRADGGGRRQPPAGDHDADGRADRHARQPDRGQRRLPKTATSTGSARTSS